MARSVTTIDRTIIRLLQQNARVSYAEMSRATGIPESTVRRRMERLQQRGIIQSAMIAEPSMLGYDLRALIGLRIELTRLDEIAKTLKAMEEVTYAAFLTGSFDIMIQVVVQSQDALVAFLTQKIARIEGVRSTETFIAPWVIKPITSWVIPQDGHFDSADEPDPDDSDAADDLPQAPRKRGRPRKVATAR